jgi:hypothetical protein
MAPPRLALGQRGTVPASVGTLCRTAILPDFPMSMAPFGLFCHSGPVLGQIKQRVQCFEIRSDLGHLQAIPRNKPIFLCRIHRHRESLLCASPVPCARNGIQAFAVPGSRPKISNGNVLWNWGIAKIYVRPQLAEIRAQLTQRGRPLSAASQFRRILSLWGPGLRGSERVARPAYLDRLPFPSLASHACDLLPIHSEALAGVSKP